MAVEFTVLASGSRGNASLVRSGGTGLLIDLGLGTRGLTKRMEHVGASWPALSAALLTHTHGDHVSESNLRALARERIPLYCHEAHRTYLSRYRGFAELEKTGIVRTYDDYPFLTPTGIRVEPIPLSHDGGPTYGFRIEAKPSRRERRIAVGYLADTGCWTSHTAESLTDVDILGVEFNYDDDMQRNSGRAPYLIARNLGNRGHLSNDQGAGLVAAVLERSSSRMVRHVVLLHLSGECNRPELAVSAAKAAIRNAGRSSRVYAAEQWLPHPHLPVTPVRGRLRSASPFPWEREGETPASRPFQLIAE